MVGPQPARYRLAVGSGQKSGRRVGSGRVEILWPERTSGSDTWKKISSTQTQIIKNFVSQLLKQFFECPTFASLKKHKKRFASLKKLKKHEFNFFQAKKTQKACI